MDRIHVETTSKRLKLAQIIVILWAAASVGLGWYLQGDRGLWVGGIGCGFAFVLHLIVRFARWWEYG